MNESELVNEGKWKSMKVTTKERGCINPIMCEYGNQ
jgi:hypothetical protein